jgi:hypothetical protein
MRECGPLWSRTPGSWAHVCCFLPFLELTLTFSHEGIGRMSSQQFYFKSLRWCRHNKLNKLYVISSGNTTNKKENHKFLPLKEKGRIIQEKEIWLCERWVDKNCHGFWWSAGFGNFPLLLKSVNTLVCERWFLHLY